MKNHLRIALVFSFVLSPFALTGCKERTKEISQAKPAGEAGSMAIPFKLKTFDGGEWSLEGMRGRIFVLNFWASWCGPCRMEAPGLQRAYMATRDAGVGFIGVAVDDTEENAKRFIKDYGLTFQTGLDSTGGISKAYNLYGIPKTYLIGRDGRVLYSHTGNISEKELTGRIRKAVE